MARPIKTTTTNSKEVTQIRQSNYITTAQYDYTPQEKRILYRVVEKAAEYRQQNQRFLTELEQKGEVYQVNEHVTFTMPITAFMSNAQLQNMSGKDYDEIVDAFKALVDKKISFRTKDAFSFGAILNYADRNKGEGSISFMVHKFVWQSALDFTRGFTKLDLITAMQLKSAYSMRFYELAKKWSDTKIWRVTTEELRQMMGCLDKYPRLEAFKRCVLDVAKEELDAAAPMSFSYEQEKRGRKVVSFVFYFYENRNFKGYEEHEHKQLLSQHPHIILSSEIKQWLQRKMQFTDNERNHNIKTLERFCKVFAASAIDELEETYQWIAAQGVRPQENKGWFIQNIKKKIENADSTPDALTDKIKGIANKYSI